MRKVLQPIYPVLVVALFLRCQEHVFPFVV